VLPKPPRLEVLLAESPLVLDGALEPLEPPLLKPEPVPLPPAPLVLVWFGAQAGAPGTAGPQFGAIAPR